MLQPKENYLTLKGGDLFKILPRIVANDKPQWVLRYNFIVFGSNQIIEIIDIDDFSILKRLWRSSRGAMTCPISRAVLLVIKDGKLYNLDISNEFLERLIIQSSEINRERVQFFSLVNDTHVKVRTEIHTFPGSLNQNLRTQTKFNIAGHETRPDYNPWVSDKNCLSQWISFLKSNQPKLDLTDNISIWANQLRIFQGKDDKNLISDFLIKRRQAKLDGILQM